MSPLERIQDFQSTKLGVALHVAVQIVVLIGLPMFGWFALTVIDHDRWKSSTEQRLASHELLVNEKLNNIKEHTNEIKHQLQKLDSKLDRVSASLTRSGE